MGCDFIQKNKRCETTDISNEFGMREHKAELARLVARETGKSLKELDAKLRERLANIFKWQNYFEVSRQTAGLTPSKPQTVKLSDDCSVEIKVLLDNQAEVKLIGKGKKKTRRKLSFH